MLHGGLCEEFMNKMFYFFFFRKVREVFHPSHRAGGAATTFTSLVCREFTLLHWQSGKRMTTPSPSHKCVSATPRLLNLFFHEFFASDSTIKIHESFAMLTVHDCTL